MSKDLEYYMGLPYVIEITPIPIDEGGGFSASLPQVGRFAVVSDGETPEEAIANLEEAKRERFSAYLEKGIEIPEPQEEKEEYSGRFVLRLPKDLHRKLALEAKKNGSSLNQYLIYLLSENFGVDKHQKQIDIITRYLNDVGKLWEVRYSYSVETEHKRPREAERKKTGELIEFPEAA